MKICLIVCYFGKFPEYFQLWLNSCACNKNLDFLIFTDNNEQYKYPSNVKKIKVTFDKMRGYIQNKFDFKISLERPYKLCDYRPAYGFIFSDYLKEYNYWGYCDIDVIFGNTEKFLNKIDFNEYNKIFKCGHFSLYKNNDTVNNNFKKMLDIETKEPLYRKVYTEDKTFLFDEDGINSDGMNNFYNQKDNKMYRNKYVIADISIKYNNFILSQYKEDGKYIFNWISNIENCTLEGIYHKKEKIEKREFMYIHLQKRKMKMLVDNEQNFWIVPNEFINIDEKDTDNKNLLYKYTKKVTLIRKEYIQYRFRNLINRAKGRSYGKTKI